MVIHRAICLSSLILASLTAFCDIIQDRYIRTTGEPTTFNELYGYASSTKGPGESAFNDCLNYATSSNTLLVVIYGKDSCATCDAFVKDFNINAGRSLAIGGTVNGYFRGSAKACDDAYAFFNAGTADKNSVGLKSAGGAKGTCHLLGFYGVAPNGQKFKYTGICPTTYKAFRDVYIDQKSAWIKFKKNNVVTAAAKFAVKDTANAQLQATRETRFVKVPLVRETMADREETDIFVVEYPDGVKSTNELAWAVSESRKDVDVPVAGKWVADKSVRMALYDSLGSLMSSCAIHFVDGGNAFAFPNLEFDVEGAWGRWTLYSDENWNSATQKVYAANTYSQPDTNNNARVESVMMGIPISPSNRYEVVYTNNLEFFEGLPSTVSNWFEIVAQPYECFGTNRTFYVQLPGNVTNEDVVARVPVPKAGDWATTNFYFYALTNGEHTVSSTEVTWTNFEATAAVGCTNFYYTVVTNEYQYGEAGREAGGRDERGIQSFVLKVTGGAVWNPATVAFATDVLDSDEFAEFCVSNKVVTLLQECSDPETGASLFSHTVAKNGRSGSAFLSRNGLDASQCEQPPASNMFEVALYRPDGTLAGILAPQMDGGVCDKNENITRLRELLALADDLTESSNNDAATSALTAQYGVTIMDEGAEEQTQTLSISDKKDVFKLEGVLAGTVVSITARSMPETRYGGQEKPALRVWKYTSNAKTETRDVPPFSVDESGAPVWKFSSSDLQYGLYADVTAWTAGYAATENHGVSTFLYPLLVDAAPEYPGEVSFVSTNMEYDIDAPTPVEIKVSRTGYTGEASARVELTTCELPATSYSWINSGNATNLVWRDGESGEKSVFVNVKNVTWEDSVSNLVFTITSVDGAVLVEQKKECKIAIQQEDDENALTGLIRITDPEPSADGSSTWKKSGVDVKVTVSRERVLNEKTGKSEARGEAYATIGVTGGALLSTNRLEWLSGERTGEREITVTMPNPGESGQRYVVLKVTGIDCDGVQISKKATSELKFTVVPADAPEFMFGIDQEAFKYVAFDSFALLSGYDDDAMELVESTCISGSLPKGLAATADGDVGSLRISGVPSETGLFTAVYQLTLRRKSDGASVKTMPVTVKIDVKALGSDAGGAQAVIPAFAEKRTWQYLPMTNSAGRLTGLLNLSASSRGSVSARYTTAGATISFNAAAIDSVVADETAGGYRARSRMTKAGSSLDVEFTTDGRVFATLAPAEGGGPLGFASEPDSRPWLSIDGGAAAWKGRYAVAIPAKEAGGAPAVITLNASSSAMVKYGKVTYNGVLPNGRPFSGVTAFVPAAEGAAEVKLPVFWSSAAECFSAMLAMSGTAGDVKVSAAEGMEPFWSPAGGEETALSTEPEGGMFVAKDWVDVWKSNFGGAEMLRVKYDGKEGNATVAGSGKSLVVADPGSAEEDGFQLESIVLNRASGMITGTLKVKIPGQNATVNFRGVALPHGKDHFMAGLAWYTEEQEGTAVRKSVPVELVPAN